MESVIIHPKFSNSSKAALFDIALIKVKEPFKLKPGGPVNAICLPHFDFPKVGLSISAGWPISDYMTYGSFEYSPCPSRDGRLCTLSISPPDCSMDNGSPLFSPINRFRQQVFFLIAVNHKDFMCRSPKNEHSIDAHVNIGPSMRWIFEKISICNNKIHAGLMQPPLQFMT